MPAFRGPGKQGQGEGRGPVAGMTNGGWYEKRFAQRRDARARGAAVTKGATRMAWSGPGLGAQKAPQCLAKFGCGFSFARPRIRVGTSTSASTNGDACTSMWRTLPKRPHRKQQ